MNRVVEFCIFNLINIPVYILLFRRFFSDKEEFLESLNFFFRPNILSMFKGEFWEDLRAELKLGGFIAICGAILTVEIIAAELIQGQRVWH